MTGAGKQEVRSFLAIDLCLSCFLFPVAVGVWKVMMPSKTEPEREKAGLTKNKDLYNSRGRVEHVSSKHFFVECPNCSTCSS